MARPSLDRNVKFKSLIRRLDLPRPYVRGLLETLWDVANECGNPVIGTPEDIEAAAEWPGEPGVWFNALREGRWIDEREVAGRWEIHDYWDHAPEYVLGRARKEAERHRERVCRECRNVFHSTEIHAIYCSPSCRQAAYRKRTVTESDEGARNSDEVARNSDVTVTERDVTVTERDVTVTERDVTVTERDVTVTESYGPPAPAPAPLKEEVSSLTSSCSEPPSTAATEPKQHGNDSTVLLDPERIVLTFPVKGPGSREWPLLESKLSEYAIAFPDLDIGGEMLRAAQWCRDNPRKQKTARGMSRFLCGWLERSQNQGQGGKNGRPRQGLDTSGLEAFLSRGARQ